MPKENMPVAGGALCAFLWPVLTPDGVAGACPRHVTHCRGRWCSRRGDDAMTVRYRSPFRVVMLARP